MRGGLASGADFIGRTLPERGFGVKEAVFGRHLVFFVKRLETLSSGDPRRGLAYGADGLSVTLDCAPLLSLRPAPGRVEAVVRRSGARRAETALAGLLDGARKGGLFTARRTEGEHTAWRLGLPELEALLAFLSDARVNAVTAPRRGLTFAARREAYATFLRSGRRCGRGGHRVDLTRARPRFEADGEALIVVCSDCLRKAWPLAA